MKNHIRLWLTFAWASVICLILTFVGIGNIAVYVLRFVHGVPSKPSMWHPVIALTIAGIVISTVLTAFMTKRFLVPIDKLINALKRVAEGDFSVQLDNKKCVAEVKKMNANFNKMVKELGGIETLRKDFIVNVSHEFKTPIAAIEGYATLLLDPDISGEDRLEYGKRILESTRRLSSLTSNVLMLSRLETQEFHPKQTCFSLDEQLRQAILSIETVWSQKELEIDMELPAFNYLGNEELLMQVWVNLFSNAVKFTPHGGIITARMEKAAGQIRVMISDTGIGMDEETQRHVFDKFYQGDRTRSMEGNGLGLALVKKILDLCGGTIQLESRPGDGSTFCVMLPEHRAEEELKP